MTKMSVFSLIIFLLIISLIYLGMHYFVYWRIASGYDLPVEYRRIIKFAFLIAALTYFLARIFGKSFLAIPLGHIGAVWMGIISIALSVFIVQMIAAWVFPRQVGLFTAIAIILVVLVSVFSMCNASRDPRVRRVEIPIAKLPPELSGFTVVMLADLHLERWKSAEWLNSVVDKTNRMYPDLIVIIGDLIDEDIRKNQGFFDALKRLDSRYGVIAVTGNHEFYAGIDVFTELCKSLKIKILRNSSITIADAIEVVGIDEDTGKRFGGVGADLEKAMEDCDVAKPTILLSHQPLYFDDAVSRGVDLQLSGHTHAGQIPPMDLITLLYFKYPYGLYQKGSSFIYTTCGTGTWAPPMRLFSRSEIVKIVLQSADIGR